MPAPKKDAVVLGAVDVAREAAESIAEPGTVGAHLGAVMEGERLATHRFTCTSPAYRGWHWAITVARVPRSRLVTVCETHLLPGEDALVAPEWLPYANRLEPGDLGPSDTLPYRPDDPNLMAGLLSLRKTLDTYANLRPCQFISQSLYNLSVLRPELAKGTDFVIRALSRPLVFVAVQFVR